MDQNLSKRRNHQTTSSSFTSVSLDHQEEEMNPKPNGEGRRLEDNFLKPNYQTRKKEGGEKYWSKEMMNNQYLSFVLKNQKLCVVVLLTLCSMFTRYFRIGLANKPIWDEVHFGKFGSYYLRGTFYHDVHPPLGKMLVAVGGKLSGYNGTFKFEGGDYPEGMHYMIMRLFHATFGVALVPMAYLTLDLLNFPFRVSFLSACLVLLDNGLTVISRFILLDSMLLIFIAMSVYFLVKFHTLQNQSFTKPWWIALFSTGISLGLASSVKWIGLFVVALVGLYTLEDLWNKLGDTEMPKAIYAKHWVSRVMGFIIAPIIVYIICFRFHFLILNNSGPGDGTMDSLFQARLNRNKLLASPPEMVFMGNVTMRSGSLDGGLLHSHPHNYPTGSGQQQMTCYGYKDENNDWTILHEHSDDNLEGTSNKDSANNITESIPDPPKVHHKDKIRLKHVMTGLLMRVQPKFDAIVSGSRAYEVSAGEGEKEHTIWEIELVDDLLLPKKPDVVQTLSSRFRLRNPATGCLLASGEKQYPDWGYSQREVYCVKDTTSTDEETLWNVEELSYEGLPPGEKRPIPAKFTNDFIRIHRAMWNTNNALIPDDDKFDHLTSQAWEWPLMRRGIRMCGWGDDEVKYYMLSNPLVVWGSTLALITYAVLFVYYQIRMRRNIREWVRSDWDEFLLVGKFFVTGWLLQYLPFFLMGRVLYVHHYFPALYFACLVTPYVLEHGLTHLGLSNRKRDQTFIVIGMLVMALYIYFAPMTFGMNFPSHQFASRGWLRTWRFTGSEVAY